MQKKQDLPVRFAATKMIEKDPLIENVWLCLKMRKAFEQSWYMSWEKDGGLTGGSACEHAL